MADPITVSQLPTADEDPEGWNVLWVAGLPVPGILVEIDGEKLRDVEHKKSKGSSRDILLDQGLEPRECSVRIRTTTGALFRELYEFYLLYLDPERPLTRRNIVPVSHPALYARGIKMGYFFGAPLPKPTQWTGIRPYLHEFKFKIVGPKTQISANSGSSKPKQQTQTRVGGPIDPIFQARGSSAAVGLITTSTPLLPGVANSLLGPPLIPPPQPAPLYTPAQLNKIASAGDPTARFAAGLLDTRAP